MDEAPPLPPLPPIERILEVTALTLYNACLIGNPPPFVANLLRWLKSPEPGDLVLEISTVHREGRVGHLGVLERIEQEDAHPGDAVGEDAGLPEEDRPGTERVYYLRGLDGRPARWFNADFIRVPTDPGLIRRLSGGREP